MIIVTLRYVMNKKSPKQKTCLKCGKFFPYSLKIDGVIKKFQHRKYCLDCSPFGAGNNKNLHRTEKVCSKCETSFPLEEFYTRQPLNDCTSKIYHYAYCKECTRKSNQENRTKVKLKCVQYLGGKCSKCGYCKCLAALDFHHKDSTTKERTIAHFRASFEKLKIELDKCVLFCSNCHREEHANELLFDYPLTPRHTK